MSVLIKYATRNRPKLFLETLENITSTIGTKDYEILVTVDEDDTATLAPDVLEKMWQYPNIKLAVCLPVSKIFAINFGFEYAKPWTWCVTMSDDIKFVVNSWDEKMLADIKRQWGESPGFFSNFPDGYVNEAIPTLNVCG